MSIYRKYTLKDLGIKGHDVCNLLSKGLEQKCVCVCRVGTCTVARGVKLTVDKYG